MKDWSSVLKEKFYNEDKIIVLVRRIEKYNNRDKNITWIWGLRYSLREKCIFKAPKLVLSVGINILVFIVVLCDIPNLRSVTKGTALLGVDWVWLWNNTLSTNQSTTAQSLSGYGIWVSVSVLSFLPTALIEIWDGHDMVMPLHDHMQQHISLNISTSLYVVDVGVVFVFLLDFHSV